MSLPGKNIKTLTLSIATAILAFALIPALSYATSPYFIVGDINDTVGSNTSGRFAGNVFAGGGFYTNPSTPCTYSTPTGPSPSAAYQTPDYNNLNATAKAGGILAYGNVGSFSNSARSEAIGQALGQIEGTTTSGTNPNFFSGPSNYGSPYYNLSFANTAPTGAGAPIYPSDYLGGLYSGGSLRPYCIYDYFGAFAPTSAPNTATSVTVNTLSGTKYLYQPSSGTLTASTTASFPAQQDTTVFVNGNLFISNNISYADYGVDTNGTKLAFVVKGNIYISPSVTSLNGLYIAEPTTPSDPNSGLITTCYDGSVPGAFTSLPLLSWVGSHCATSLTVNGALISKNIALLRTTGDVGTSTVAESIRFTNDMVLGGPFFNPTIPAGNATIDSLVNLPPVF